MIQKVLPIIFLSLFMSFVVNAQSETKEQSKAEMFSDKAGTLIQKEFIDVGNIKKCKVQLARFTDLISNQSTNAVRFELETSGTYSRTKLALLDADEIDGAIKSIKLIQEKVTPSSPANYTEVSYRSRSGFQLGCYHNKGKWSVYMKLERFDSDSYVLMDDAELPVMLGVLEKVKGML